MSEDFTKYMNAPDGAVVKISAGVAIMNLDNYVEQARKMDQMETLLKHLIETTNELNDVRQENIQLKERLKNLGASDY